MARGTQFTIARMIDTETVRKAMRLSEIVSEYVALKPTGGRLQGLCPFHSEKTPSFSIDDNRGLFHCFGCGAGGDVFAFVMRIDKVEFKTALRRIASRAGIVVDGPSERELWKVEERRAVRERRAQLSQWRESRLNALAVQLHSLDVACDDANDSLHFSRGLAEEDAAWAYFGLLAFERDRAEYEQMRLQSATKGSTLFALREAAGE